MRGFERSDNLEHPEARDAGGRPWPDDFSPDEKEFAAELRDLFPIEEEVLPPLYVQTLLDDDLRAPLGKGYIRKLTATVMARLGLPRTLNPRRRPLMALERLSLRAAASSAVSSARRAGAPVIAALSILMALVIGTVYLATPSFAEGLRLLLGQTGAQQLNSYPTNVTKPGKRHHDATAHGAPTPVYWLGQTAGPYSYLGMSLLEQQDWSNGPVLDIQYILSTSAQSANGAQTSGAAGATSVAAKGGSGLLDIREFQLSSSYVAVLQAVQDGSASITTVGGQQAVYVDGMWVVTQGGRWVWQAGTRSMLIFQRQGVIFWVSADQRDGMSMYALTQIAERLTQTTLQNLRPSRLPARLGSADPDATLRAPLGANAELLDVLTRADATNAQAGTFVTPSMPAPSQMG